MFRTPVMFAPDEPGAAAVAEPAVAAPEATPAPAPAGAETGAVTAPVSEPVAPTEPPNWEAKVTEWGGEDAVARALRIDKALDTPEGQEALIVQGLTARGFNPQQIEAFLKSNQAPAPVEQGETIEQLLADPDRQLTAGEIQRVLDARDKQANEVRSNEQLIAVTTNTISKVMTELAIPEVNHKTILTIADGFLPQPGVIPNDQSVIDAAIRRGAAEFDRQVQEAAKARVEGIAAVGATLPTPLPSGGTGGTEAPSEPRNLADAGAAVRAKHGFK